MNVWGLFFSFTVPGVVLGMMIMAAIYAELAKRRRCRRKGEYS